MDAALGLLRARPAALAARAGLGARCAADRGIALVVQRVIGEIALEDPLPKVLLGPQGKRVVLVDAATLVVPLDQLRIHARGTLLASDAGDPALRVGQSTLQRRHLRDRAAVLRS